MNAYTKPCDPERISRFVQRTTTADEERELELHLTQCAACRSRLSTLTASPEVWDKASEYLRDDLHDSDSQVGSSSSNGGYEHLSQNIRSVLESLAPTDDPAMLGRIDGYEISGVIGSGGMGVVLKGLDRSLNRVVAIKVMAPHLASSGAARKRFAREAQAAAAITHVNVIDIYGVAEANGLPYLVMPYARGPSLQKRIDNSGALQVAEVLRIGSQAAAGLSAAHAQGLVHRDIKPANMILNEGVERLFITDFGLARAVDDASVTRTGVIAGTPQYMSPEQARGESIDHRSDLFSLGSVLYSLCTGRPPFRAEGAYGILRRITDEEPRSIREINPEIPDWLCGIIAKLMSKKADDRYGSAQELAELLEQCLAHVQQPTTVQLPVEVASLSTPVKRRTKLRWIAITSIAVVMSLIGMLGLSAMLGAAAPDVSGTWHDETWGDVDLKPSTAGEYDGIFAGIDGKSQGIIRLRWSKKESRFNGTWSDSELQAGKISLRLSQDGEIHGALTSKQNDSNSEPTETPQSKPVDQSKPQVESGPANASSPANSIAVKRPRLGDFIWRRTPAVPSAEAKVGNGNPLQKTQSLNISNIADPVDFRVSNIRTEEHLLKFTLSQTGPPVTDAFLEIQFNCDKAAVLPERGAHSLDEFYLTPQHTVLWLGTPFEERFVELPIKDGGRTIVFAFPDSASATKAARQLKSIGDQQLLESQDKANSIPIGLQNDGVIFGDHPEIGHFRTDFRLLFRSLAPNASSGQIPPQRIHSEPDWQKLYIVQAMSPQSQLRLALTEQQKQEIGKLNAEFMKSATPLTQHEWEPRTQAAMQDVLTLQQDQQLRHSIWLMLNVAKFRGSKVQEALNLTKDQRSQVAKVWDELGMQIGKIRDAREASGQARPKWGEGIGVDSMAIHQKVFDDILKILTAEQKRKFFSELQNPVFPNVSMQSPYGSATDGETKSGGHSMPTRFIDALKQDMERAMAPFPLLDLVLDDIRLLEGSALEVLGRPVMEDREQYGRDHPELAKDFEAWQKDYRDVIRVTEIIPELFEEDNTREMMVTVARLLIRSEDIPRVPKERLAEAHKQLGETPTDETVSKVFIGLDIENIHNLRRELRESGEKVPHTGAHEDHLRLLEWARTHLDFARIYCAIDQSEMIRQIRKLQESVDPATEFLFEESHPIAKDQKLSFVSRRGHEEVRPGERAYHALSEPSQDVTWKAGEQAARLKNTEALEVTHVIIDRLTEGKILWRCFGIPKTERAVSLQGLRREDATVSDFIGQILLWRDGHVLSVNSQSAKELSLPPHFIGRRGTVRVDKSGRHFLVYLHNRLTNLPKQPEEHDRVHVVSFDESGKPVSVEITVEGVSLCGAFWSADGRTVLGQGLSMPAQVADLTIPDLTSDFVSWEFDIEQGITSRQKLPGNLQILDINSDGTSLLSYRFQKEGYAIGIYSVPDEAFVELSKPGELPVGNFRLSPNGKSVLGRIDQTGNAGLFPDLVLIDVATKTRKLVTVPNDIYVHEACWSPDGKRIAFAWEPKSAYIARMNRFGPTVPDEDIPKVTITIAKPHGTEARDIYTEQQYRYGSLDWGVVFPFKPPTDSAQLRESLEKQLANEIVTFPLYEGLMVGEDELAENLMIAERALFDDREAFNALTPELANDFQQWKESFRAVIRSQETIPALIESQEQRPLMLWAASLLHSGKMPGIDNPAIAKLRTGLPDKPSDDQLLLFLKDAYQSDFAQFEGALQRVNPKLAPTEQQQEHCRKAEALRLLEDIQTMYIDFAHSNSQIKQLQKQLEEIPSRAPFPSIESNHGKATTPEASGKPLGTVLGKPVYESELNQNVELIQNLETLFVRPVVEQYLTEQKIDPAADLEKRIPHEGRRAAALLMIRNRVLQKHLYDKSGGRVLLTAFGPVAYDAYKQWLIDREQAGDFKIADPEHRKLLFATWEQDTNPKLTSSPQVIKEAFDPAVTERIIEASMRVPAGAIKDATHRLIGEVLSQNLYFPPEALADKQQLPGMLRYLIVPKLEENYWKRHPEIEPSVSEVDVIHARFKAGEAEAKFVFQTALDEVEKQLKNADPNSAEFKQLQAQQQGIERKLVSGDSRPRATIIARARKFHKHLYDQYGGGRALETNQGIVEAFDAQKKWVEEQERLGAFQIADPALREAFYQYWAGGARQKGETLIDDLEQSRQRLGDGAGKQGE